MRSVTFFNKQLHESIQIDENNEYESLELLPNGVVVHMYVDHNWFQREVYYSPNTWEEFFIAETVIEGGRI